MPRLVLGYIFVITMLAVPILGIAGLFDPWAGLAWADLPLSGKLTASWIVFSGLTLWLWMLTDFFRGRKVKHRVVVAFLLFFASWLAAVLYFLFIYSRAPTQNASNVATNSAI